MKLADKFILITGASKGFGREIALRLCRYNLSLILIARTKSLLEQTQKEIETLSGKKAMIIPCDISSETEVNRAADLIAGSFKYIDVQINNAAIAFHKKSEDMSNDEMRKQFEVNFFGTFYFIKALLPLLNLSDSAYILNVNSLVSKFALADNSIYAATKAALARYTDGLRRELKGLNIHVGSFFPGLMRTSFQHDRKPGYKFPPFITVGPEEAAVKIEKMIIRRKKSAYARRWIISIIMKLKQLIG